ncbi:putative MFS transporter [Sphaerosporella brunnea]|uniref:Putative MFS transporter n=1 Tax=Sphaerosporella brunnea TaxID=1250544 RepID=A0A5J5EXE5_9PEZI|nr:putative MFS transporter [Sphaerosporella brunnea]
MLCTASWISLAATFSSTSRFPAMPEIAQEVGTTGETISISNAGIRCAMGMSSFIWAPISSVLGRSFAYKCAIFVFLVCSIGTAFVALRCLAGFEAIFFMAAGQGLLADVFHPSTMGTAVGFFISGIVNGPALVTFAHWRAIFWVQAGMAGVGLVLALLFVPNSVGPQASSNQNRQKRMSPQPLPIVKIPIYPNVLLTHAVEHVFPPNATRSLINPRFHLTSPLVSGLGFLLGTIVGSKWADMTMTKYVQKRRGVRVPQDRLNSELLAFFLLLPAAKIMYGWSLEKTFGGFALPTLAIFFAAWDIDGRIQ